MDLVDHAVRAGWNLRRACRVQRWWRRRDAGQLADKRPGAAVHGLLEQEAEAILALFEDWGATDRSHRKLAHRGSYTGRVWVSPSSVRRVLTLADKHFRPLPKPGKSRRRPFPDWVSMPV